MTFIDPSLSKVFDTLVNNDKIIDFLKEYGIIITKSRLYDSYTPEQVEKMEAEIYTSNVSTLYEIAEVLLKYSDVIKENDVWYLLSNKVAWDELAYAAGTTPAHFSVDVYKEIIYTYKYCYAKSFFQNNRDKFLPEVDFNEIEKNGAANAFYDAMMKEFDKLDTIISRSADFASFDDIPDEYVNYLSQLVGFEQSTIDGGDLDIIKYKELVKNILDIYRIKGTNYSFELFFNFMGFNIEIKEYWFDRRLYYTTNSAGNEETSESNNGLYEYYLTIHKPSENVLKNIGIAETVSESDYTQQYSLLEFNELCEKYTAAAVLGYSPTYPVYNDNGDLIGTEEYTGKVYKYFKTNVVFYNVSLDKANPTASQLSSITKYLEFLTPSYVMRKLIVETYSEKSEEPIGFDGDGKKPTDPYGNFNGFEILDSEDWSQDYQNEYIINPGTSPKKTAHDYVGKEETFEDYRNSLGGTEFRLPLGHRSVAGSVSRFQTYTNNVKYPVYSRVKFYVLHTLNGQLTNDWGREDVVITPYYTVPPYVGNTSYKHMKTQWEKNTTTINLTGGDGKGGEDDLKTRIRDAKLITPVDYLTDKTIDEFVESEEFNELEVVETFARKLTKVDTIQYGTGTAYDNAYQAFAWNYAQRRYHICNISNDYDSFREDALNKTQEHIGNFFSELYTLEQINNWYKNDVIKNVTFGDYILAYNGTLENGNLFLYRYGYYPYPNKKSNTYVTDYPEYVKNIDYVVQKDYRGSIGNNVILSTSFATKATLSAIEAAVDAAKKRMITLSESNNSSNWLDLDAVTKQLYYCSTNGNYYRAIKVPALNGIANTLQYKFNSMDEALNFFNNNPLKKIVNVEFWVEGDTLYTFKYKNRAKGTLIYSTKDEALYMVCGNSRQDIKEVKHFFGNLKIENDTAYIDAYDEYWFGYDEQADEEDFIFYNSPHKITWDILGYNKDEISRPVKASTDYDFDTNEADYLSTYNIGDKLINFDTSSGSPKYFKTIGEKIVEEISKQTINAFTDRELINWLAVNDEGQSGGILSIIEENFEKITVDDFGYQKNNTFEFYSKASDFFKDYYRIAILGNVNDNSIPKLIKEKLKPEITMEDLKNCYKTILTEISTELDKITKDRIFYAPVGNWRNRVEPNIYKWNEKDEGGNLIGVIPVGEDGFIDDNYIYANPLDDNYGAKRKQKIDGKYFYDEKTAFVSIIANKIQELKDTFGEDEIVFDIDSDLLGKDCYSLSGRYEYFEDGYTYLFRTAEDPKKAIRIDDKFYLCRDTDYNYFIAYTLNFGLNNYSIDFYGKLRDPYTEFTQLFDLLHRADKEEIDAFLKKYYYDKLVSLYREAALEDNEPLGIEIRGNKPFKAYPGLFERLNGKAGSFINSSTLLSSYKNNGGKDDKNCFLKFDKCSINVSNENIATLKFYVTRSDFMDAFGYDYNLYYQYLDIQRGKTQEEIANLRAAIEVMVKKQFACIKPLFDFKDKDYYKKNKFQSGLSYFQQNRTSFEKDYDTATIESVDANLKPITNSIGLPISSTGSVLTASSDITNRINQTKYLIITITDKVRSDNENAKRIFKQIGTEESNVKGMLVVKKLTASLKDNFLSIPHSLDWIEKDVENNPTEYTSFGDDRNVTISSVNTTVNAIDIVNDKATAEKYLTANINNSYHQEEVAEFNEFGQILTSAGYVNFDKTKLLKDQGYSISYKKTPRRVKKLTKEENTKEIKISNSVILNANNINCYTDLEGNYVCEIPTSVLHTSEIKKIALLFYVLYEKIKRVRIINISSILPLAGETGFFHSLKNLLKISNYTSAMFKLVALPVLQKAETRKYISVNKISSIAQFIGRVFLFKFREISKISSVTQFVGKRILPRFIEISKFSSITQFVGRRILPRFIEISKLKAITICIIRNITPYKNKEISKFSSITQFVGRVVLSRFREISKFSPITQFVGRVVLSRFREISKFSSITQFVGRRILPINKFNIKFNYAKRVVAEPMVKIYGSIDQLAFAYFKSFSKQIQQKIESNVHNFSPYILFNKVSSKIQYAEVYISPLFYFSGKIITTIVNKFRYKRFINEDYFKINNQKLVLITKNNSQEILEINNSSSSNCLLINNTNCLAKSYNNIVIDNFDDFLRAERKYELYKQDFLSNDGFYLLKEIKSLEERPEGFNLGSNSSAFLINENINYLFKDVYDNFINKETAMDLFYSRELVQTEPSIKLKNKINNLFLSKYNFEAKITTRNLNKIINILKDLTNEVWVNDPQQGEYLERIDFTNITFEEYKNRFTEDELIDILTDFGISAGEIYFKENGTVKTLRFYQLTDNIINPGSLKLQVFAWKKTLNISNFVRHSFEKVHIDVLAVIKYIGEINTLIKESYISRIIGSSNEMFDSYFTIEKPWIPATLSVGNKETYNNNFKFVDEVIATSSKEDPDFLNKYNTVWESEEHGLNTND
jgi:hypothetical protein